jgi:hypothetical protein
MDNLLGIFIYQNNYAEPYGPSSGASEVKRRNANPIL